MPPDKAPGPDGFTGLFYKECWDLIKQDLIAASQQLYDLRGACFNFVNSASIVLIPKKNDVLRVADSGPIRFDSVDLQELLTSFPGECKQFPCKLSRPTAP